MKVKKLYSFVATATFLTILNIAFLIGVESAMGLCVSVSAATNAQLIYSDGRTEDYDDIEQAWSNASGKGNITFKLMNDWSRKKKRLKVTKSYSGITIDLNGRVFERTSTNHADDGEVIWVESGAVLNIIDSNPNYTTTDRENAGKPKGGIIAGGSSEDGAGGIHLKSGSTLNMTGGTIYKCETDEDGGGIYADGAKVNIKNAAIVSCCTEDSSNDCDGGAIYTKESSKIKLENVKFVSNSSEDNGGAIFCNSSEITLDGCTFQSNTCEDNGGAIYQKSGKIIVRNCQFKNNGAEDNGGAIYFNKPRMEVYDSIFNFNNAGKSGGAIFVNDLQFYLIDSRIEGNTCGSNGGGIYVDADYEINMNGRIVVSGNSQKNKTENGDVTLQRDGSEQAVIYCGHFEKGSSVGLNVTGSLKSSGYTVVKSITADLINTKAFFANRGNLIQRDVGKRTEIFMATAVNSYHYGPYVAITLEIIGAAAVIIVAFKKRKSIKQQVD